MRCSGGSDWLAVDDELDAAEQLHLKAGGGDDDVGGDSSRRMLRRSPSGVKRSISAGRDRDLAGSDGLEQVAVRDEAQPLVPGLVGRREVALDGVARRERLRGPARASIGRLVLGFPPRLRGRNRCRAVGSSTGYRMSGARRENPLEPRRDAVARRARDHVARRALHHGDLRRRPWRARERG